MPADASFEGSISGGSKATSELVSRGFAAVVVGQAVILAATLCSAAQGYNIRVTPADTAKASRSLLRLTDLPSHSFWRGGRVRVQRTGSQLFTQTAGGGCVGPIIDTDPIEVTGEAVNEFRASNDSQRVESTAQVVATHAMLEQDWNLARVNRTPKALRCEQRYFTDTSQTLTAYRVTPLQLPNLTEHAYAYRIQFTFRKTFLGQRMYGIKDAFFLAANRTESDLLITANLGTKSQAQHAERLVAAAELRLLRTVAARTK